MTKKSPIIIPKKDQEILIHRKRELEEKQRALRDGLPHLYGWKWYRWAKEWHDSYAKMKLLVAANQISKMLQVSEIIPTFSGFKKVSDIKIGDELIGWDGIPTEVVAIPFEGADDCYEFEFDDDTKIVSSKDHIWWAKSYDERFRKTYTKGDRVWPNPTYGQWKLFSTKDIYEIGKYSPEAKATNRFSIPLCSAVDYPFKNLPDPYLVGLLLGDGALTHSISLTNPVVEIGAYVLGKGAKKINLTDKSKCPAYSCAFFKREAESLGMLGKRAIDKEIPDQYLTASIDQRKDLLAGLMDTDGTALKHGVYYYSTISEKLKEGVVELVNSLGGKCRVSKRGAGYKKDGVFHKCHDCYEVTVLTDFNPFRLAKHKYDRWHPIRYKHERVLRKVTPIGVREGRCFTVANDTGSFLATKNYIVTHNSSTQIRTCIDWATEERHWPYISNRKPRLFWYLYPTQDVIKTEIDTKWVPEFLPQGEYKDSPKYGWQIERSSKAVEAIHFNSGIVLQFKTYAQGAKVLQTSTLDYVACDEELPELLYDELRARLMATDGIFSMVFTATLGQEMWWRAMEARGDQELFKDALKMNVSMYDCLYYADGTKAHWTEDRIEKIKRACKSKNEVLKRVYGRFVKDEGKKYPTFNPERHYIAPKEIPTSYRLYSGTDIGSGGGEGHPAAIIWLAVSPDNKVGYVIDGWRGDTQVTTTGDILEKFKAMKYSVPLNKYQIASQAYDSQSKDFFTIATRAGEPFTPAKKNQEQGEDMINTLLKCGMLYIFDTDELRKLGSEMMSLLSMTAKTKAKDDFIDALRFAVMSVPWDWTAIEEGTAHPPDDADHEELRERAESRRRSTLTEEELMALQIRERRGEFEEKEQDGWGVEAEIEEWNASYGS